MVAQQSGWDPDTFLGKVFASLQMRFAGEHDVLGIRTFGEGTSEDLLHMAIEEPEAWGRSTPAMRKRKYSSCENE